MLSEPKDYDLVSFAIQIPSTSEMNVGHPAAIVFHPQNLKRLPMAGVESRLAPDSISKTIKMRSGAVTTALIQRRRFISISSG